jgi:Cu-Zn family superoxide dismutase
MRCILLGLAGLLVIGGLMAGSAAAQTATAELRNAQGEAVGTASLTEGPQGVRILLTIAKLPPGRHGFHIHAVGVCDPPSFASAGGHFNPGGKQHGWMNPGGAHAGDLPNLVVCADGAAQVEVYAPHVTLADGPESLFHPGGTALVLHAGPDDEVTDPAGNSGNRIACGIIHK